MSVIDSKTTLRNLKKKGFVESNKDHKYLHLYLNDRFVLSTKISHGSSDIGEELIRAMSFQCALSKSEFLDLAKCPMSKDEYLEILERKGLLK